jgi:integrase
VLAIPGKRFTRTLVEFLTLAEVDALLDAPDRRTFFGGRDHALILLAVQTGLRLSDMTGLKRQDIIFGVGARKKPGTIMPETPPPMVTTRKVRVQARAVPHRRWRKRSHGANTILSASRPMTTITSMTPIT